MSFCTKCGKQLSEGTKFCPDCGAPVVETRQAYEETHYEEPKYEQPYQQPLNTAGIENIDVALGVILSIITCGIYMFYWMYKLNAASAQLAEEPNPTDGALVIIFTIITCGIYGVYWNYKLGERMDKLNGGSSSNNVLYLILALFGLSIINNALAQDIINKKIA